MAGKSPKKPESTLRPPERGTTESVRLRRPRPSAPGLEAGSDAPTSGEVGRAPVDAAASSAPAVPVPDRQARVEQLMRELARAGPEADEPLRRRAQTLGPSVLGVAAHCFPGMLWIDLSRPHRPIRHARNLSALCVLMIDFGEAAVPHVANLLRSRDVDARICAALVAVDLPYGGLVEPLAARLHDEQPGVRDAAMLALRGMWHLPEAADLRARLLSTLRDRSAPADARERAAWALGTVREAEAIE
ncbi:MAG: hypothetical protein IT378_24335, partial [Sandaracinaceae bacterium]|nr:hypothetical protein [Sandaracinaceae bacterium]